jgi:hypothetical protein
VPTLVGGPLTRELAGEITASLVRSGRRHALVVVVDGGTVLTPDAVRELVAEYLVAPGRCLLYGDELRTGASEPARIVLKPGFAPSHVLAQDVVGPVAAVDTATLAVAFDVDPRPVRTVAELAARLVDVPLAARRVPRVLAHRRAGEPAVLAESGVAALVRRGHDDAAATPVPGAWPVAVDLRWRPRHAGRVSLVVSVPLGDPGSCERIAELHETAASSWPDVELVVVDATVDGYRAPRDAAVVRGPRSAAPAATANAGARAATGDTLVFADEWTGVDVTAIDWLPLLLMHLDDRWVAATGSLLVDGGGTAVRSGGLWVHPDAGPAELQPTDPALRSATGADHVPRAVTAVRGAGMAIRAEQWHRLGGFASHLPGMLHEIDLCRRAQVGGRRVVAEPRSRLRYHGVLLEVWPWTSALADELAARAPGTPDPASEHGHPYMDWRRPGRPVFPA